MAYDTKSNTALNQQTMMSLISGEVTLQLREHRRAIEQLIDNKMVNLKSEIARTVQEEMNKHKAQTQKEFNLLNTNIDRLRSTSHVSPGDNQLALTTQQETKMALAVAKKVKQDVLATINKEIMPQIEKLGSWVQYQTQDTDVLLTDYRRAVCEDKDRSEFLRLPGGTTGYNGAARTQPSKGGQFGPFTKFAFDDDDIV